MAFSQATILSVSPPQVCGSQVYVSWSSSSPAGTWFQVYVNQQLAWSGQRLLGLDPHPHRAGADRHRRRRSRRAGYGLLRLAPPGPARRVQLTWQSGTYKGIDLAGFRVYGPTPGWRGR